MPDCRRPRPAAANRPGRRPAPPGRRAQPRRPRRRWGLRVAAATALLVLVTSGAGHAMVSSVDSNLERVDPFQALDGRPDAGAGTNILLIGNDSREGISEADRIAYGIGGEACHCADTIILIHLSSDRERASIVSLPRDSYTELPAHTLDDGAGETHEPHPDKLNAALSHGGPGLMVAAVENMTGVRIDHYLEVNFLSFMRGVDELGGVDVCTVRPLKDEKAGLDLPAGTSTLSGAEALSYVRARSVDATADFGRMQRQQRFLASFLDRVASAEVLLNPARISGTAEVMLDSVRVDPGFGAEEIVALGRALRGFSAGSAELTSVPIGDSQTELPSGAAAVSWDDKAAKRLFSAIREDRPLTAEPDQETPRTGQDTAEPPAGKDPDDAAVRPGQVVPIELAPQEIEVRVENHSGRDGVAGRVDRALAATGFATRGTDGSADNGQPDGAAQSRTTITHDTGSREAAIALRTAVPGAQLREAAGHGEQLLLAVGEDYAGVQRVRDGRQPLSAEELDDGGFAATTGDQMLCD